MTREIWKAVLGFEGLYEVSNLGNVRSIDRVVVSKKGIPLKLKGVDLRPRPYDKFGHVSVVLYKNPDRFYRPIHQLVLEAFVGPRLDKMEGRHLNGIPWDNNLKNLRWGTSKENKADMHLHGTSPRGENNGMSKLTEDQVRSIRKDPRYHHEIAADYNIARSVITRIKNKTRWRYVSD